MSTRRSGIAGLLLFAVSLLAHEAARAGEPAGVPGLAIDGYSPVSYFTKGVAEQGSADHAVQTADGMTYYLASAEQAALFRANPEKYRPRYRYCPFGLVYGKKLPLDPTNFRIVAGHLLLFHRSAEQGDGLAAWKNEQLTDSELLQRADGAYRLLTL